jgi:cytochrome oxidase Cu insertion factor (SCO1/SenC/PrrC family)
MKNYQKEFGDNPAFQLLSFTVNPAGDGPEQLREFTKTFKIEGDNWWFLTDQENPDAIEKYLTSQMRFEPISEVPKAERLNDFDLFQHDMRLGLVDHQGNVRGLYQVLNSSAGDIINEKLGKDIKALLSDAGEGGSSGIPPIVFYAIIGATAVFIIGVSVLGKKKAS